ASQCGAINVTEFMSHPKLEVDRAGIKVQVNPCRHAVGQIDVQRIIMAVLLAPKHRYEHRLKSRKPADEVLYLDNPVFANANFSPKLSGHCLQIFVIPHWLLQPRWLREPIEW